MAEHQLGRGFRGARTLVRDQQALASAALAALTRAADEARAATGVRPSVFQSSWASLLWSKVLRR